RRGSSAGAADAWLRASSSSTWVLCSWDSICSTWLRRSWFSSTRRASSASTRSRKASTSSSLYPRFPIGGLLNATLCTSAGVRPTRSPHALLGCGNPGSPSPGLNQSHQYEHDQQQHHNG